MYDRILVPTDGGEQALEAARRAFDLAERYDAAALAFRRRPSRRRTRRDPRRPPA
jgi:nucleotide-binding universal stress UspA family protein